MPFPSTESSKENSAGRPHRATESWGDHLVKGDEGMQYWEGRSWNIPSMLGTEIHLTVHSRPAWEAEVELNAIPAPEKQLEHLRGQNPRAAPAPPLASSQL